ncbi:MAG: helix-turn-helix transcriptional regulator [Acidobacteriia bacterium]|nr:helix-turn-helix transcriptional regulator [Terriglobia bacterium]
MADTNVLEVVDGPARVIRRARRILGLSVHELALRADCSPSHLSRVERGLARPGPDLLARVLEVLTVEEPRL